MGNQIIFKEKLKSNEVRSFISKYIPSVSHLNVVLLLYQNPYQDFSPKMIEEHLHLSLESILRIFADLVTNKMASKKGEKDSSYWYLPGEEKNNIIALLNEAYAKNRRDVISLILMK